MPRLKLQRRLRTSRLNLRSTSCQLDVRILVAFQVKLNTTAVLGFLGTHFWYLLVSFSAYRFSVVLATLPGLKAFDRVNCLHAKERAHRAIFDADLVIHVVCKLRN